jgi:hypothetical protein
MENIDNIPNKIIKELQNECNFLKWILQQIKDIKKEWNQNICILDDEEIRNKLSTILDIEINYKINISTIECEINKTKIEIEKIEPIKFKTNYKTQDMLGGQTHKTWNLNVNKLEKLINKKIFEIWDLIKEQN